MIDINLTTPIINLNVSGLHISTKRNRYKWKHVDAVLAKCQWKEKTYKKTRNKHLLDISNTFTCLERNQHN